MKTQRFNIIKFSFSNKEKAIIARNYSAFTNAIDAEFRPGDNIESLSYKTHATIINSIGGKK